LVPAGLSAAAVDVTVVATTMGRVSASATFKVSADAAGAAYVAPTCVFTSKL